MIPSKNASDDHTLATMTQAAEAVHLARPHAVGAIMTHRVKSCVADDTLSRVAQIMWDERCGVVPVVDDVDRPVAMVTDRDVAMAAYIQGQPLDAIAVRSAMSKSLFSVHVAQSIWSAEGIMRRQGVRRLPVVDDQRRLVGVVSIDDIARHVSQCTSTADALSPQAFAATVAALSHSRPAGSR
jgi:CBS domain-containing protein